MIEHQTDRQTGRQTVFKKRREDSQEKKGGKREVPLSGEPSSASFFYLLFKLHTGICSLQPKDNTPPGSSVVEYLPGRLKPLGSIPITRKKGKEKRKTGEGGMEERGGEGWKEIHPGCPFCARRHCPAGETERMTCTMKLAIGKSSLHPKKGEYRVAFH